MNRSGQWTFLHTNAHEIKESTLVMEKAFQEKRDEAESTSCITLRLTSSNLSNYFLSSTYLPTFVVAVIGYMTFFFPVNDFSDRFIVSLTGLLVEAAFFMQTSSSIPQTAYIKMIDIWFMFCIVYFFLLMTALLLINKCLVRNGRKIMHDQALGLSPSLAQ
ncbi:ligand-gated ion channel 50-like [Macrobrachium nipponense]|uniref:ligand-gated ion channel 50-like n=1 Tax=Macrobrachium nipponense TaxID=159736 RepID=UPI0030C7B67B